MELEFRSTETLTQEAFAEWVQRQEWRGARARYELLSGRVVMNPPAGYPHGEIEANLSGLLWAFVKQRGLGRVLGSSQGFELPSGDTVEPDLSFISNARWSAAPAAVRGKFLKVVPDLVVEILSPGNSQTDLEDKRRIYERVGVREYWLVDGAARELTILTLADGRYRHSQTFSADQVVRTEVLAGLELVPSELFPR